MSTSVEGHQRPRTGTNLNIAIVGAGISGLRCADLLTRAGAVVTIFEARSHIGGRCHQVENGGHLIDTGSNWIHGTEGNPIMKLAEKTKTDILDPPEGHVVIDTQGKRRSDKESNELAASFWDWIVKAMKYSEANSADIDSNRSLLDWLEEQWSKSYPGQDAHIKDLVEETRQWGQFVGSPIERQSLKFFWLEDGMDGGNVFVAGTYKKIFGEIARPALERADIRLNAEVEHIAYRNKDDNTTAVRLHLADGSGHDFDEVVVTCPLGYVKQHASTLFKPVLPKRLLQAIDNIGYGALEKLYIAFPSAFWLDGNDTQSYPCFTTFHNPTGYHAILRKKGIETTSWNQSVLSLQHLPGKSAHPTLLFYMTGDSGAYLNKKLQGLEVHSDEYNAVCRLFAEPFLSRLPNYDSSRPECRSVSFYQTMWQSDRLAGNGSYSTFRTGLEDGGTDIEVMRAAGGLGEAGQGLWMAGEHTAPFVALGTTTGAYWSGEGIARKIVKQYGLVLESDELERLSAPEAETDSTKTVTVNAGKNLNGVAADSNICRKGSE